LQRTKVKGSTIKELLLMDTRIVIYQVEGSKLEEDEKTIAAFDPGGHTGIAILRQSGALHGYGIAEGIETEQDKRLLMASLRPHQPGAFVYEKYLGGQGKTFTQDVIGVLNWIAGAFNIPTVAQSPIERKAFEAQATGLMLTFALATRWNNSLYGVREHVLSATAHALCYWYQQQRKLLNQVVEQATREIWSEMI
jgi:hypothetical protein